MDHIDPLAVYLAIRERPAFGCFYKRECNLPRELARAVAAIHRSCGHTARIREMRTNRGSWNVYLDHGFCPRRKGSHNVAY